VVIEERRVRSHPGGWAEYRTEREAESERRPAKPRSAASPPSKREGPSKNRRALIERLEGEVEAAQAALDAVEQELADPARWSTPQRSDESGRRHERARRELDRAYAAWEEASEDGG
jgi:ATP-binding cassette subfamily F protein uup